jgi:anti-sigma regulatory factor (Ser/Thr protein kinase)
VKQRGEEEREEGGRGRRAKARIMWEVTMNRNLCVVEQRHHSHTSKAENHPTYS